MKASGWLLVSILDGYKRIALNASSGTGGLGWTTGELGVRVRTVEIRALASRRVCEVDERQVLGHARPVDERYGSNSPRPSYCGCMRASWLMRAFGLPHHRYRGEPGMRLSAIPEAQRAEAVS
jgi:hypothetical protein